jgi:hypothetical protein
MRFRPGNASICGIKYALAYQALKCNISMVISEKTFIDLAVIRWVEVESAKSFSDNSFEAIDVTPFIGPVLMRAGGYAAAG